MAGFGFFTNAVKFATNIFAEAGKTFSEAYKFTSSFIKAEDKTHFYRVYREAKQYERVKPFMKNLPGKYKVASPFIIPTDAKLKDKYMFVFDVNFKYKGVELPEIRTMSILSPENMSPALAEHKMQTIINHHRMREKYGEIEEISFELIAVRVAGWLA